MDATTLLEQLNTGKTTAAQLAAEAISRIEARQPQLNAAAEVRKEDVVHQLAHLPDGPLKGLPISVKECYAIKGKTITSGSKRMKPINCTEDSTVVRKLREAGAVILVRGNTSEFLLGRETDNLRMGTTNNVFDATLTAGGSSGGEATMVATECVAFGIGTDIGGSCRYPAVFNGIVGFKPASGQINKSGIFPSAGVSFTESMNSPGILTRSVRDARLVYNIIGDKQLTAGRDATHVQVLTCNSFKVSVEDDSITQAMDASIAFFKSGGYSLRDISLPESGELYVLFAILMCAGFTSEIYKWSVTERRDRLTFIGELFRRLAGRPTISNELFSMLLPFNFLNPSPKKLEKTIATITALRKKYNEVLADSVLVLPTVGILAPKHRNFIKRYNKPGVIDIITPVSFCNVLNLSCITLPAWKYQKSKDINPPGVQLVCAAGYEERLLNVAERLEGSLGMSDKS